MKTKLLQSLAVIILWLSSAASILGNIATGGAWTNNNSILWAFLIILAVTSLLIAYQVYVEQSENVNASSPSTVPIQTFQPTKNPVLLASLCFVISFGIFLSAYTSLARLGYEYNIDAQVLIRSKYTLLVPFAFFIVLFPIVLPVIILRPKINAESSAAILKQVDDFQHTARMLEIPFIDIEKIKYKFFVTHIRTLLKIAVFCVLYVYLIIYLWAWVFLCIKLNIFPDFADNIYVWPIDSLSLITNILNSAIILCVNVIFLCAIKYLLAKSTGMIAYLILLQFTRNSNKEDAIKSNDTN